MKIFKGILIVLYLFIVVGSIQNYSANYNGAAVFSLAGIIDNFVITLILPFIIYGIGLLVRKYFFKRN
jgi:nucleoside recognition membrane protein YjiH